jgi:hypothetical protein
MVGDDGPSMFYIGVVTVAAGRVSSVRMLRWLVVVGALFAVALFGGSSWGEGPVPSASVATNGACPNVILQASLPGALVAAADGRGGAPEGGHGPADALAGACLFVVVALVSLAGAARRPLLTYVASWWAGFRARRVRPLSVAPMWSGVLRI